jgi:hypothetical protein
MVIYSILSGLYSFDSYTPSWRTGLLTFKPSRLGNSALVYSVIGVIKFPGYPVPTPFRLKTKINDPLVFETP